MKFLKIKEISKVDWGNTNLTKKAYVESGIYLGFSAAGPDGRLNHFEHEKNKPAMSAIGANCGKMYFIEEKFTAIKNTIVFNPNENLVIPKYLYYFCDFYSFPKRGAGQPFIAKTDIGNTELPVPSLQEQEKIVERLDKVFEATMILKNNSNDEIQLFKNIKEKLFVDTFFDLDLNLSSLELATKNITDGSHNPAKGIDESEYLMLSSKNVADDELNFEKPRYLNEIDFTKEHKRTNLEIDDVLLTIVGTIGRSAVVDKPLKNITFQRSVCVIKPNKEILNPYYLKYFLDSISDYLEKNSKGVAQKGIYLNQIRGIQIPLMDLKLQKSVVSKLSSVNKTTKNFINNKNRLLEKYQLLEKSLLKKEFSYE